MAISRGNQMTLSGHSGTRHDAVATSCPQTCSTRRWPGRRVSKRRWMERV